jgi:hypothetical protein
VIDLASTKGGAASPMSPRAKHGVTTSAIQNGVAVLGFKFKHSQSATTGTTASTGTTTRPWNAKWCKCFAMVFVILATIAIVVPLVVIQNKK